MAGQARIESHCDRPSGHFEADNDRFDCRPDSSAVAPKTRQNQRECRRGEWRQPQAPSAVVPTSFLAGVPKNLLCRVVAVCDDSLEVAKDHASADVVEKIRRDA